MVLYRMKEVEDILLLALRPLIKMANVWHERSRTDGEFLAASQSLIDALGLTSQAVHRVNMIRVSSL